MKRDVRFPSLARLTVLGIGGGGGQAVNDMLGRSLSDAEFIAVDTDAMALSQVKAPTRLTIRSNVGASLVGAQGGMGCGGDAGRGEEAAHACLPELRNLFAGCDMLFILAGLGGGAGTGAAPVIAEAARAEGILTVAIVTMPFLIEGRQKAHTAHAGLARLRAAADTLIVIPGNKLLRLTPVGTPLAALFRLADSVMAEVVRGLVELISVPGFINLDFADVRAVMSDGGISLVTIGRASGPDRALQVAHEVAHSPLLDRSIAGARRLLINISAGPSLSLLEIGQATEAIKRLAHRDADLFLGTVIDPAMGEKMQATVLATHIERNALTTPSAARADGWLGRDSQVVERVEWVDVEGSNLL